MRKKFRRISASDHLSFLRSAANGRATVSLSQAQVIAAVEVLSLTLRALHGRVSTRLSIALRRVARVIPEVVDKFMQCGDFAKGFARVRCDECSHEYLLAFSCKGRWFCPSCHQTKVQIFGAMLAESILAALPHRHFTFTIPKMLRPYFRFQLGLNLDCSSNSVASRINA